MKKIFLISLVFINLAGEKLHISQKIQARTREVLARKYGLSETFRDFRTAAMCCMLGGCILSPLAISHTIDGNCCMATTAALCCFIRSHVCLFNKIELGDERQSCWNFCCPKTQLIAQVKQEIKHRYIEKANKEGSIV